MAAASMPSSSSRTPAVIPHRQQGATEGGPGVANHARGGCRGCRPAPVTLSRSGKADPAPGARRMPASGDEQRAWLAYIRVQLRLAYGTMSRQLLADSGAVAARLRRAGGTERRRRGPDAGHGAGRPDRLGAQPGVPPRATDEAPRGLVTCALSAADMRGHRGDPDRPGAAGSGEAAPGHVDLVRRLVGFGGLLKPPGGAARRGAGIRVRQHHQARLAPAAGRLAPGGGLTRPRRAACVLRLPRPRQRVGQPGGRRDLSPRVRSREGRKPTQATWPAGSLPGR